MRVSIVVKGPMLYKANGSTYKRSTHGIRDTMVELSPRVFVGERQVGHAVSMRTVELYGTECLLYECEVEAAASFAHLEKTKEGWLIGKTIEAALWTSGIYPTKLRT